MGGASCRPESSALRREPCWTRAGCRRSLPRPLTTARLPGHFSPHSLRHSFASLLLQQGESPAYVQRQLGRASIQLAVDTYGRWLPAGNQGAVNRLDDPSGSKVIAKTESATSAVLEVADPFGGPSRTRTLDPLIESCPEPRTQDTQADLSLPTQSNPE